MSLLIVTEQAAQGEAWQDLLRSAGLTPAGVAGRHNLVRDAVRLAPEAIVLVTDLLDDSWCDALALMQQARQVPVLLVGPSTLPDDLSRLLPLGVAGWLPGQPEPASVAQALRWAAWRHARDAALRAELDSAKARLDERKWVDRAKGMLMRHQQLSEDDAFALLRTASMQAHLRVGELSRSVVEAALAAEAVNRAGQLRMLSQRLVKALAQRVASVERHRADELLTETTQRVQANLQSLAAMALAEPAAGLLAQARNAWAALQACAANAGLAPQDLTLADGLADDLLQAADALTGALERGSGRPHLQVVNLSGRQRMLSQRLGKQALLAGVLAGDASARQADLAAETVQAFEAALSMLEQAPLSTPAIRANLAQARGQWQRLLEGLRPAAGRTTLHEAQLAMARESEALLASFETLTSLYEHSMQVLLG